MKFAYFRTIWSRTPFLLVGFLSVATTAMAVNPKTQEKTAWISAASNEFAIKLYEQLAKRHETQNLIFSPISLETALAMTYAGARGNTASQMATVLHLPADNHALHQNFGRYLNRLTATKTTGEYQVSLANALWGQEGYTFLPEFVRLLETNYEAGLRNLNFKSDSEGARKTINRWVERKTQDKIKDLIGEGVLTPSTRMVLTNAIYFKCNWASEFEKNATREEFFHLSTRQQKKVPLMHRTGSYGYTEETDLQILSLPYVGEELSMVILLPNRLDGLAELEKKLTFEKLSKWLTGLREQEVAATIPRFQTTAQFELNDTLESLGMHDAFDATSADFSGITGNRDFCISDVIHKAFVEVNEQGTEAAAATGVVMKLTAAGPPSPLPVFRADHPFLFLIRDEGSGAILFMGRLLDPES